MKGIFLALLLSLLLCSCQRTTLKELRTRSCCVMQEMTALLQKIETKKDLEKGAPKLKALHEKLVDLVEKSAPFASEVAEESLGISSELRQASDNLKEQMVRVLEIGDTYELMIEIQENALHRLDQISAQESKSL